MTREQAIRAWWEDVREGARDADNCPDNALREAVGYLVRDIRSMPEDEDHVAWLLAENERLRSLFNDAAELAAVRGVALAERLALPVLRTCGDCGWSRPEPAERWRCGHRNAKPGNIIRAAAPPPSCPLWQDAPGGQR